MAFRNLVVINGKAVELKDLPQEEQDRLADMWNRRAAECLNYKEDKKDKTA